MRVVDDLDTHVARFRAAAEERGARTFVARTAAEANEYVVEVCRNRRCCRWLRSRSRW